jgi:hypothetical protein
LVTRERGVNHREFKEFREIRTRTGSLIFLISL